MLVHDPAAAIMGHPVSLQPSTLRTRPRLATRKERSDSCSASRTSRGDRRGHDVTQPGPKVWTGHVRGGVLVQHFPARQAAGAATLLLQLLTRAWIPRKNVALTMTELEMPDEHEPDELPWKVESLPRYGDLAAKTIPYEAVPPNDPEDLIFQGSC